MSALWVFTEIEQTALWLSLRVSLWSVLLSLPFGIGMGWLLARARFWGKSIFEVVIHLPLVMPPVATGYGLLILFGQKGLIGQTLYEILGISFMFSWKGAVLASMIVSFPLMVRAVRLSVEGIDHKLEVAARTLGAKPLRVFYTITLPLMLPGIVTGTLLVFVRSLGEFGATITFVSNIQGETSTIPLALFTFIQQPGGEEAALRLALLSIGLSFIGLWSSEWITRLINRHLLGTT